MSYGLREKGQFFSNTPWCLFLLLISWVVWTRGDSSALPLVLVLPPRTSVPVPQTWSSITLQLFCYTELRCHSGDCCLLILSGQLLLLPPMMKWGPSYPSPQGTCWLSCHFLGCLQAPMGHSHISEAAVYKEGGHFPWLLTDFAPKNSQKLYVETGLSFLNRSLIIP